MGNHEFSWILRKRQLDDAKNPFDIEPFREPVSPRLTSEDWTYLESLPLMISLPEYRIVVVHAGLDPRSSLDRQKSNDLLNIRTVGKDGKPSNRPDGELWGSLWKGPETVVFGHHARRGLQHHRHAIGIDTGCVYGGRLTAYVLPDRRLVSVAAKRPYVPTP
jgi:diadenosine tetraphosphatase ApaH/serine/threonine PP2A family protein phosphatase